MNVLVNHLTKTYPTQRALDGISFALKSGEMLCVSGPSGSGKSTLLRCICGLEQAEEGAIEFQDDHGHPWKDPQMAMVFDQPRLFPYLNLYENIALGLEHLHYTKSEIAQRVEAVAQELEIKEYLKRRPASCSTGQCQRAALARALVRPFDLLLMDEALANLDEALKRRVIDILLRDQKEKGFSCLYVTHNRFEQECLGCNILTLEQGRIKESHDEGGRS